MDRLTVTLTFFFFFFFFFLISSFTTYAISIDIIDKTDAIGTTVSERHLSGNFPDTETKTNSGIILPSEKPESNPGTILDWESDDTDDLELSSEQTTKPETQSVPLTAMSLRSMGLAGFRSPGRVVHPLRIRPCRHHRQPLKPLGPGFRGREVSYGDDMLISGGFTAIGPLRGGERHIKGRRVRFHPEGTRFPSLREPVKWVEPREDHKDETEPTEWITAETGPTETLKEEQENHEDRHHHHGKGWFMGKVRKFLNQP